MLNDVTINVQTLFSFYVSLVLHKDSAKLVRSITFTAVGLDRIDGDLRDHEQLEILMKRHWIDGIMRSKGLDPENTESTLFLAEQLYLQLANLQTLIILKAVFMIPFQVRTNGRLVPLPFLTNSLKKLFIPMPTADKENFQRKEHRLVNGLL